MKEYRWAFRLCVCFALISNNTFSQTLERIGFSSLSSSDDNFQPIAGTPYGASLSGSGGSLQISSEYGSSLYVESSLGITSLLNPSIVQVFPNPTLNSIVVDMTLLNFQGVIIQLYDGTGKLLIENSTIEKTAFIDLSNFSSGTYLLKILHKTNQIENFQIVKIH